MTRRQPERVEQRQIVNLLRSLGATVYVLGTTRRQGDHMGTMQTPGIPDLWAFLPARSGVSTLYLCLWVEVKAPGGRLRPEQRAFRDQCTARGVPHVVGGVDAVIAWLIDAGYLLPQNVAHYHRPKETAQCHD
jgi:hypothetical protein